MAASPPLRAGIIGCGNITVNDHIPALQRIPEIEVLALADPVPARRELALLKLGLPAQAGYETHTRMLADQPLDFVLLATPPAFRSEIVATCAKKGVHVLAEKPAATIPAEADAQKEMMRAAGLKFGFVHNYLFYPEYRLLREQIAQGAVGDVRHITLNFLGVPDNPGNDDYNPRWRHHPAEAGGGVLMDMIHALYLAEFLMGENIQAVSAVVDNLGGPVGGVEDLALVQLFFEAGYVSVQMGWGHGPGGVEVSGSEGRMLVFYRDYRTGPFDILDSMTLINARGRKEIHPGVEHNGLDNFVAIQQDFARAIRVDSAPAGSPEIACRCLETALAAYTSALQGRVIELPFEKNHPVYEQGAAGLKQIPPWGKSRLLKRGLFGLEAS